MKQTIKTKSGLEIPVLGFGTFGLEADMAEEIILSALKAGYRHIDTAQSYQTEEAVGNAVRKSAIPRAEIFITTKIWAMNLSYDGVMSSFERSLKRLQMDYVDLVLTHQPFGDLYGAWRALIELKAAGKIHVLGTSNLTTDRAYELGTLASSVMPEVNQIMINPYHSHRTQIESLQKQGIIPAAWAPFAQGADGIFSNGTLVAIGQKYHKTAAQIILNWLVSQDLIVLSKSTNPERMAQNLNIFDFELTNQETAAIEALNQGDDGLFLGNQPEAQIAFIDWAKNRDLTV